MGKFDWFCVGGIVTCFLVAQFMVDGKYDIRRYYEKPYCEKAKVGNTEIEKCYKVVEVVK